MRDDPYRFERRAIKDCCLLIVFLFIIIMTLNSAFAQELNTTQNATAPSPVFASPSITPPSLDSSCFSRGGWLGSVDSSMCKVSSWIESSLSTSTPILYYPLLAIIFLAGYAMLYSNPSVSYGLIGLGLLILYSHFG